ncbi:hypothetical protein ABBQ38_014791 [Trebouxia sp. C0009 RCD-2024]
MNLTGCVKLPLAAPVARSLRSPPSRLAFHVHQRHLLRPYRTLARKNGLAFVPKATSTLEQTQELGQSAAVEPLNWTKQWYPVHAVVDLDPARPHAVNLLGKELVVWNDGQQWRCFEDLCPHRKVPLSEGRVEAGKLECAYHGWKFDSAGKTVSIPQVSDKDAEARASNNKRSCCTTFPTQEQQGLIWVWPESSPSAYLESAVQELALCPEYQQHEDGWAWTFEYFVRDVPGSFEFWMENMMDQSHVPHAHSEVAVKTRHFSPETELFQFLGWDPRENQPQKGFAMDYKVTFSPKGLSGQQLEFRPPALCRFTVPTTSTSGFALWIYAVPTTSNTTRLIISAGFNPSLASVKQPDAKLDLAAVKQTVTRALLSLRPRWVGHMALNGITDGDITFMHRQSSFAKQAQDKRPLSNYFLPSPSDKGVSIWHRWIETKGGGGPKYADNAPPQTFKTALGTLDRAALLDRASHVRNCTACTKAVEQIKALQQGAVVASVASVLLTAALLGKGSDAVSVPVISSLLLAAGCSVAGLKLQELQKHFGFLDWQHSEH